VSVRSLAQAVFDAWLRHPRVGWVDRSIARALGLVRRVLCTLGDVRVRYKLHDTELELPLSHALPMYRQAHPRYSENIGRLAQQVAARYPALTCIDIGSNIGDTVAILFAHGRFPVLCIEGNDFYYELLRRNLAPFGDLVVTEKAFVGDRQGLFPGRIQAAFGTGAVVPDSTGSHAVPVQRLSDILNRRPEFRASKLIKIDTDGFDCRIIRSETQLFGEIRPVLFFEYDPHHDARQGEDDYGVFGDLKLLGYRGVLVYEHTGELLLSSSLADDGVMEGVHRHCLSPRRPCYVDVCVFHEDDQSLFDEVSQAERCLFRSSSGKEPDAP
jgi:FkbM family methyltransferase